MRTTINNLAVDSARRQQRQQRVAVYVAAAEAVPDPSLDILDKQIGAWLRDKVADLPPPQQDVIRRVCEGEKPREIAAVAGTSLKAVESHLRRARVMLRRAAEAP